MSGSKAPSVPPNPTLYVKNLRSTIKKPELRRQLYALFIVYGRVLDVVATRADGMRGQAFVVFEDLAGSTAALRALDGFSFYGQPLALDYAKSISKATIVHERGPEALSDPKVMAGMKDQRASRVTFSSAGAELQGRERKRAREEAGQRGETVADSESDESDDDRIAGKDEEDESGPSSKRRKSEALNGGMESGVGSAAS